MKDMAATDVYGITHIEHGDIEEVHRKWWYCTQLKSSLRDDTYAARREALGCDIWEAEMDEVYLTCFFCVAWWHGAR